MNKLITTTPIDEPLCEHDRPAWHCTICGEINAACAAMQGYYDATIPGRNIISSNQASVTLPVEQPQGSRLVKTCKRIIT